MLKVTFSYFISFRSCSQTTCRICQYTTTQRRVSSSASSKCRTPTINYGRCELDSHADTIVAGSNCTVLNFTGKECDVSPFRDDYTPISNAKICNAATAWQSHHTRQTYILVLNEGLWMGDSMGHSLINPNQLRDFGTRVQDNPMADVPLAIISEDSEFCMELEMAGTIIFADTFTPLDADLATYPSFIESYMGSSPSQISTVRLYIGRRNGRTKVY